MPSSSDGAEQVKRPPGTSSWSASRATSTRSLFARTGCAEHDAEDVFQDVFARAYERLGSLRDDAAIRPWLAQLTRNACVDRLRRRRGSSRGGAGRGGTDAMLEQLDEALDVHEGWRRSRATAGRSSTASSPATRATARSARRSTCRPARSRAGSPAASASYVSNSREENPAPTRLEDRERHIRIRRRAPGRAAERPPPAPAGWVRAAQELPAARRGIDEIVERARVDSEFRVRLVADLEAALAAAGYEPTDELVDAVRACLPELDQ